MFGNLLAHPGIFLYSFHVLAIPRGYGAYRAISINLNQCHGPLLSGEQNKPNLHKPRF